MKSIINNSLRVAALAALWMASGLFQSCNKEEESLKSVDLRYRVDDSYERLAVNPEPIVFQVKSTDPWEIFGEAQDEGWYTITPAKGEAGKTYDVTIVMKENTNLDDREDVLTIKSDYWTGKTFAIKQFGNAYLEAEDVVMTSDGGTAKIAVSTNQKWSAEVTSGTEWLKITAGASGEFDGEISIEVPANAGEQRVGEITLYDRYDRAAWLATCTEEGVILSPIEPDGGRSWYMVWDNAQEITIPVDSNADWTVEKVNATDDWFEVVESRTISGNGQFTIKFSENTGENVRTGKVNLLTVSSVAGVTPVVKELEFRQASTSVPTVRGTDIATSAGQVLATDCGPGRYDFYVANCPSVFGANPGPGINIIWPEFKPDDRQVARISWWTNNLDNPPAGGVYSWPASYQYASSANRYSTRKTLTIGKPYKWSLAFYEHRMEDGTRLYVEWYFEDEPKPFVTAISNESGQNMNFLWEDLIAKGGATVAISLGGFTLEKWAFTPAVDWGEYVPVELQKRPAEQ